MKENLVKVTLEFDGEVEKLENEFVLLASRKGNDLEVRMQGRSSNDDLVKMMLRINEAITEQMGEEVFSRILLGNMLEDLADGLKDKDCENCESKDECESYGVDVSDHRRNN